MRSKLIAFEVLLLLVSAGFYVWSIREQPKNRTDTATSDQPVFANLDVSRVKTVELRSGEERIELRKLSDQDQQSQQQTADQSGQTIQKQSQKVQATMTRGPYREDFDPDWVIQSFHNYGVERDLVKNRVLKPLRKLRRGTVEARSKQNLADFGLDKPNRRRIILRDEAGNVIKSVALGKRMTGFEETGPPGVGSSGGGEESIYYFDATDAGEQLEVRLGKSEFSELPLDPQEWAHKQIFSYNEDQVPLIGLKHKEKFYLLRYREQTSEQGESETAQEGDTKSGEPSGSNENWELYSGDYYADRLISRNSPVLWRENQLMWEGPNGQRQSISLTKRNVDQNTADRLAGTLSSLEAENVLPPVEAPADSARVPDKEKARYGFEDPVSVLYLGEFQEFQRSGEVMVFRARFHLGQKSNEEETTYMSSLNTGSAVQQVMQSIMGFGGQSGTRAKQLIPVFSLSSMDKNQLVNPADLVKEEEGDDQNGEEDTSGEEESGTGDSGSESPSSKVGTKENSEEGNSSSGEGGGSESKASDERQTDETSGGSEDNESENTSSSN